MSKPSMAIVPGPLDPALQAFDETQFRLGVGTYATVGAWEYTDPGREYVMAAGGSDIIGAGPDRTFIAGDDVGEYVNGVRATYQHLLTAGSRIGRAAGVVIQNLTLQPFPAWPTKALQVWARDVRIDHVQVQALWGERGVLEGEGFGILVNNAPGNLSDGAVRLDDCRVEALPGAYACAFYVGTPYEKNRNLAESTLYRCRATCPSTYTTRAHCGFGIQSNQTLVECSSDGFERAIFSDTGAGEGVKIRKFTATGCSIGLELRASKPEWHRRRIDVEDSTFVFGGGKHGYVAGLVLGDDCTGEERPVMEDITFTGCMFVDASPDPGHVGSSNGPAFKPVIFEECQFVGAWDDAQAKKAGWIFDRCRFTK